MAIGQLYLLGDFLSALGGRVEFDEYYMTIAVAVRQKANCKGRKVGALLVRENRIISTGYNGTPEGMKNCLDGGCVRCKNRETYKSERRLRRLYLRAC